MLKYGHESQLGVRSQDGQTERLIVGSNMTDSWLHTTGRLLHPQHEDVPCRGDRDPHYKAYFIFCIPHWSWRLLVGDINTQLQS